MAELPTGTVTFLFTDIEGSTARWERQPEAHAGGAGPPRRAAPRGHRRPRRPRLQDAWATRFCAAFAAPRTPLAAALAAQRAPRRPSRGARSAPLRVRMALHTGAAEERDGDYFGAALNRVARGCWRRPRRPGAALAGDGRAGARRAAAGVRLRDLGEHRLKDLIRPERVFQLLHPDLPDRLPAAALAGRAAEQPAAPADQLHRARAGDGRGQAAARGDAAADADRDGRLPARRAWRCRWRPTCWTTYPDGVWLVELAPLADPALVPQTVASALGVREQAGRPLHADAAGAPRSPRSCCWCWTTASTWSTACAALADALLRACPDLRILATSREALGIAGETTWRVPSLSLPDPRQPASGGRARGGAASVRGGAAVRRARRWRSRPASR